MNENKVKSLMQRRQMLATITEPEGPVYLAWCSDVSLGPVYKGRALYGADTDAEAVAKAILAYPTDTFVVADPTVWPFLSRWPLDASGKPERFAVADFGSAPYPYDAWRSFIAHATTAERFVVFFTDGQPVAVQRGGKWRDPDGSHQVAAHPDTNRPDNKTTIPVRLAWWSKTVYPWWKDELKRLSMGELITRHYWDRNVLHWASVVER